MFNVILNKIITIHSMEIIECDLSNCEHFQSMIIDLVKSILAICQNDKKISQALVNFINLMKNNKKFLYYFHKYNYNICLSLLSDKEYKEYKIFGYNQLIDHLYNLNDARNNLIDRNITPQYENLAKVCAKQIEQIMKNNNFTEVLKKLPNYN